MKKTNNLIIGYGQIGKSLHELFKKKNLPVNIYDPNIRSYNKLSKIKNLRFMHLCYPQYQDFFSATKFYLDFFKPYSTIIHSTVEVGMTQNINTSLKDIHRKMSVFHSPVRGMHPNLKKSLLVFTKYLGIDPRLKRDSSIVRSTIKHLEILRMKVKTLKSPETELGKLLSTFQYACHILLADELFNICKKVKLDYNKVISEFNKTYNDGYKIVSKGKYSRSLLVPDIKKGFGGHCLVSNIKLLKKMRIKNWYTKEILKIGQKK